MLSKESKLQVEEHILAIKKILLKELSEEEYNLLVTTIDLLQQVTQASIQALPAEQEKKDN